ncbi:hypothetical protein BJ165DRAFT_1510128 [Panaeolus papilionaceus]|nr:hypothetical protein BJ165DRAFT_1510128 [Panaeolus papilionaceus]
MKRKGKEITLTEVKRRFRFSDSLGRGTMCWRVRDGNGGFLILKQQFVEDARLGSEAEILNGLDIPGVVKMHAFRSFPSSRDSSNRGLKRTEERNGFRDRVMQRILLDEHDSVVSKVCPEWTYWSPFVMPFLVSIQSYRTRDCVLIDVLVSIAHQAFWKKGILHGDMSWNNIVYAAKTDKSPHGVLIDFDGSINYHNASREELLAVNSLVRRFLCLSEVKRTAANSILVGDSRLPIAQH